MRTVFRVVAAGCIAMLIGCGHAEHDHEKTPKLAVTKPQRKDTTLSQTYVSQIRAIRHVELRALEKGYVENIHMDEGQTVEEGTLLFEVMPSIYRAELDKAAAEADFAKIEYDNTERLRQNNIVAPSELNLAKAKRNKFGAKLSLAQVRLSFTQIKAPFKGITGRLKVRRGSLVEEGELLTTLSDNNEMWVYFNVPESEYIDFKNEPEKDQNQDVKLIMANQQPYAHTGKITAIEADFNNKTGNIAFRATFPNPEGLLRHGQTGNIVLEKPLPHALLIPQKASFEILDSRYVFVVDEHNQIHSRRIKILADLPDIFIISDGLTEQDTILLNGLRKVHEGDTIEPDFKAPEEVMSDLKAYAE